MTKRLTADPAQLSELIATIYDCAVEPGGWRDALGTIAQRLNAGTSALYLIDFQTRSPLLFSQWGMPDDKALEWQRDSADDVTVLHAELAARADDDPNEPQVYSRLFTVDERANMRIDREWARPLGICDVISTTVSTTPLHVGMLVATKHDEVGPATESEVAVMRALAPHVRKAVEIGDLLEMRRLEANGLQATIDSMQVGILIVSTEARILVGNACAQRMLRAGTIMATKSDHLLLTDPASQKQLATALLQLQSNNDAGSPCSASLIPVASSALPMVLMHVLPLATGAARSRLVPRGIAALVIPDSHAPAAAILDAVAGTFGLTSAERRVFAILAGGRAPLDVVALTGLSINTVKTHLQQIFTKTGTKRQAELVALSARLALSIGPAPAPSTNT